MEYFLSGRAHARASLDGAHSLSHQLGLVRELLREARGHDEVFGLDAQGHRANGFA